MTGPDMVSFSLIKESPPSKVTNLLLSDIIAAANDAVTRLSAAARYHAVARPAVAAHIDELAQQIAGVTLDALRTWPHATG